MVLKILFKLNLTYNEVEYILAKNYICTELKYFSFPHGVCEIKEISNTLKYILPENIEIGVIANDITMKTILSIENIEIGVIANDITMKTILSIDTNENELLSFSKESFSFIQYWDSQKLVIPKEFVPAKNLLISLDHLLIYYRIELMFGIVIVSN